MKDLRGGFEKLIKMKSIFQVNSQKLSLKESHINNGECCISLTALKALGVDFSDEVNRYIKL